MYIQSSLSIGVVIYFHCTTGQPFLLNIILETALLVSENEAELVL